MVKLLPTHMHTDYVRTGLLITISPGLAYRRLAGINCIHDYDYELYRSKCALLKITY